MSKLVKKYGRVIACLAVIFVCGQGIGFAIATKFLRPPDQGATAGLESGLDAEAREDWIRRASAGLAASLDLEPSQIPAVEDVLRRKAGQIWQERDRALFQIRLYLLEAHDEIVPALEGGQREKLSESRQRLEKEIRENFPSILNERSE